MKEPAPELTLGGVLGRLSEYLDGLADEIHAVEFVIGEELGSGLSQATSGITRLQRLDFVRQSLEDLAILTLALSRQSKGDLPPGIGAQLRLDATRHLLRSKSRSHWAVAQDESLGDVDLF
ncbi:hypothetical protein AB2B41_19915 [Marimonas sp. MJW-29]|uniref:Uncharacterized protein n=1 Tax=Sulfitobacter sediminis TaxID=3234186 RepID=A0ABV3RSK0_9RHOB